MGLFLKCIINYTPLLVREEITHLGRNVVPYALLEFMIEIYKGYRGYLICEENLFMKLASCST